jgi:hypothetical protein
MRRGIVRAVSSTLLLVLVIFMPHHDSIEGLKCGSLPAQQSSVLLFSELYPCALSNDEYLVVSSQSGLHLNLREWSITDGEGWLQFIADEWLIPSGSYTISWNESSFWNAYGRFPDISLDKSYSAGILSSNGSFRLGDSGDTIALYSPQGVLADYVCFGSCNASSIGWSGQPIPSLMHGEVVKRICAGEMFQDSNSATDWLHFRDFRYGYTEFASRAFTVSSGSATAFTSPDCSLDIVLETLDRSMARISLCTYELSSAPVTTALLNARNRGVDVHVLVDGSPAGGIGLDEVACLSVMSMGGVDVLTIRGNASRNAVQHIGALHAKYVVSDSLETIVMSENMVEQGVPTDKVFGNRGWGLRVCDVEFARFVESIFESDSRLSRKDVVRWQDDGRFNRSAVLPVVPVTNHTKGMLAPFRLDRNATITAYPSPDCSLSNPYLCDLIRSSSAILAEQFQSDLFWEQRWTGTDGLSPIIAGILASVRHNGSAKVLFDSSWFNQERNDAVVDSLLRNATMVGLDGEFKLLDERSPITGLHNKGVVLDGRYALVSSNNWVSASYSRNREMGLMIDSWEIADYFSNAFVLDWYPDDCAPAADAGPDIQLDVGDTAVISAESSRDDRMILEMSWDVDGDGQSESRNRSIEFVGLVPGTYRVVLTVQDAWGNRATDEALITVVMPDGSHTGKPRTLVRELSWTVPLAAGAAVLFARWHRRARPPHDSRNLNHNRSA